MQRYIRGYLARRRHQPRISGVRKLGALKANVAQMENIARQLKRDAEVVAGNVRNVYGQVEQAIARIKADQRMPAKEVDALCESVLAAVNRQSAELKVKLQEQKSAEEQERLRQIQAQLEAEKRAKEEEERRLREEEENRRL